MHKKSCQPNNQQPFVGPNKPDTDKLPSDHNNNLKLQDCDAGSGDARPENQHTPAKPCYKVVDIQGRGRAVVATRVVKYGELILTGYATFCVKEDLSDVEEKYEKLTVKQKEAIKKLHNVFPELGLKGLFKTNATNWKNGLLRLDIEGIQFNHSCLNNVEEFANIDTVRTVANRDIEEGEELCLCYANPWCNFGGKMSYETGRYLCQIKCRQAILRSNWRFDCACKLCKMDVKERLQIENTWLHCLAIEEEIDKLQNSAKLAKADPEDANRKILIAVQEADEIMKSNHNIFPLKHAKFIVFLGFQYAVRLGKLDVAESYVKELYCLALIMNGEEDPQTKYVHRIMQNKSLWDSEGLKLKMS